MPVGVDEHRADEPDDGGVVGEDADDVARQWCSWVALDEIPAIVEHLLATPLDGPANVVSPNPVRAAEVTATLARILGRRPRRAVPAFLLRLLLGEMADALLLASRFSQLIRWPAFRMLHRRLDKEPVP